jgi:signal transduction histidine kinase
MIPNENTATLADSRRRARFRAISGDFDKLHHSHDASPHYVDTLGREHETEFDPDSLQRTHQALATAAHDLKTPLTILGGYIELLMDEDLGPLTEKQRTVLDDMHRSEQRLQRFIKNFLSYSQFRATQLDINVETADLNASVSELIALWNPQFEKKGVALLLLTAKELEPFAFDPVKVQHITSNLLDNALKFSPERGTVWVAIEPHIWERRNSESRPQSTIERRKQPLSRANSVRVTVADSGPGISPEFHQEIFEDFFRLSHDDQGSGLGLAIARRLVQLLGGKIWVESEPGTGSKFSFLIPLRQVA